jgi:hypothetical protein
MPVIVDWTRVVSILLRAIHTTEVFVGCLANPDEIEMVSGGRRREGGVKKQGGRMGGSHEQRDWMENNEKNEKRPAMTGTG